MTVGAILGVVALHPITMVIYWLEFQDELAGPFVSLGRFLAQRMWLSFTPEMLPMSGLFAALGGGAAVAFSAFERVLLVKERTARNLRDELARDLPLVLERGETEEIEFKASLRWDHARNSINRSLETAAVRAIAGFLNGAGGSLVLGVDDEGGVRGLERDYGTLHRPDRDGYQQFVMDLVRRRLGGDLCPNVHLGFARVDGLDVCRVVVEPSERPVYLEEGKDPGLYLRMGASTRRLDVREAVEYVARRWPSGGGRSSRFRGWLRWSRSRGAGR